MIMKVKTFIEKYSTAILEREAAMFVGAGFSAPAGFVNWKELLRPIAEELDLDINKEEGDLISLAQYYCNEKKGRGDINQLISDTYRKKFRITKNHHIISELPIDTYWTTNYDELLEKSFENAGKTCDVKIRGEDFPVSRKSRDMVLYKIHGDINSVDQAVITKDDYENFYETRKLFITALRGDLVSKTFLFIGYSFNDPNLEYILSRIRIILGKNQRSHYCIMREVKKTDYSNDSEFEYAKIKQNLRINDLQRFSIHTILIKEYAEITDILNEISKKIKLNTIFVSGSANDYGDWGENKAILFMNSLSTRLIKEGFKIASGLGQGVGRHIINGALRQIFSTSLRHLDEYIILRPFPHFIENDHQNELIKSAYRTEMISNAGIALFMFGNKIKNGAPVNADGIVEEFEIALQRKVFPLPIGATGFVSEKLWEMVNKKYDQLFKENQELRKDFLKLNDKKAEIDELIESLIRILNWIRRPNG